MKNLGIVFATLVLMLPLAFPAVTAYANDERPTAKACLWHPAPVLPVGIVCATGTIGHVGPFNCNVARNGCDVTMTGDLTVEPGACGWLKQGNLNRCAADKPEPVHSDETAFYAAGEYRMVSEVCISEPTTTVTVQCEQLVHYFVVPSQKTPAVAVPDPVQVVQYALDLVDSLTVKAQGKLVYSSPTFDVYQITTFD